LLGEIGRAGGADRYAGEAQQGVGTENATGGKYGATEQVQRTSEGARDRAPPGDAGLWNVERQGFVLTAEDAPHLLAGWCPWVAGWSIRLTCELR
jgi:hypothetical protein